MTSIRLTKQIKNVPFFYGTKTEFPKFEQDAFPLAKQYDRFRTFTDKMQMPVADQDKSVEEVQAMSFTDEEIKHSLTWNIISRAIK